MCVPSSSEPLSALATLPSHLTDVTRRRVERRMNASSKGRRPVRCLRLGSTEPADDDREAGGTASGLEETLIRRMTRLAIAHGAVNLSQGSPTRRRCTTWCGAGRGDARRTEERLRADRIDDGARPAGRARRRGPRGARSDRKGVAGGRAEPARPVQSVLVSVRAPGAAARDRGLHRPALRAPAGFPRRRSPSCSGASEGMAAAFCALFEPGDGVVVMQPLPRALSVAGAIFGLVPHVRDIARGPRRRRVAARPRRGRRRRLRSVGQGVHRDTPQNPPARC